MNMQLWGAAANIKLSSMWVCIIYSVQLRKQLTSSCNEIEILSSAINKLAKHADIAGARNN
jgi:hypothetical protein